MTDSAPDVPPPVPTLEKVSLADDFVDIFAHPGRVFARRANSGFFTITVILTVILGLLFLGNRGTMQGIMDAEFARGMAATAKQNPAMTEQQIAMGKKVAGYITMFGGFVGVPIMILITGLGAWITGKLLDAKMGYSTATTIAAYSIMPRILEAFAVNAQGWLIDTEALTGRFQLSLGVGRFLDPEMSPGILGLLGRIDVFTLWVTVLLAIGIATVGKLSREKAVVAGVVMWILGALPAFWALIKG